jgi:type I restriction enzyme M protein
MANECNLNIPRYVDTLKEDEQIDIGQIKANIQRIKAELAEVEVEMARYLDELGL